MADKQRLVSMLIFIRFGKEQYRLFHEFRKTATKTSKIKINMPNAVEKASIHNIHKIQVLESVKTNKGKRYKV